ncbi:MAG: DUF305 domain-containing protein [Chlorobiaceae bacterium]|nr:DUF305 domain-containing protein [Chlorobiaceae bacterium]
MKNISLSLAVALSIVMAVIGIGAGYWLTPQYSLSMYDKNTMNLGQADKWVDLRYLDGMIAHHRGAILLAEKASISQRTEIRNLCKEILKNEPVAIAELYQWKKEWYGDQRKVRDPEVANLGSSDSKLELRFLNALIAHHENGVRMTREIRLKSSRSEVLDNADAVEQFLKGGLGMLREWRKEWYNLIDTNPYL